MSAAIEVADLHYTYPDGQHALAGVSFRVMSGERVALLGPNGAGKTTLAHHLNGIRRADRGAVNVGDLTLADETLNEIRKRVGLVFQNPDDQLFMPTVAEDVAFGPANLGLTGSSLESAISSALDAVGAQDLRNRVPHHLSGGERRRVSLATVLAMNPSILILDEPTAGLDPAGRRELIEVLQALDVAQLIITHDLYFALELCSRAMIMDEGVIVADGETAVLLSNEQLLGRHRLEMPYRP